MGQGNRTPHVNLKAVKGEIRLGVGGPSGAPSSTDMLAKTDVRGIKDSTGYINVITLRGWNKSPKILFK